MTAFYLLPGSDGNTRVWTAIATLLASGGDAGVAVPLAGDGESGVEPGLRKQVERTEETIRRGSAPAVLVGYSYSGLVASAVVRRGAVAIAAVIYVDAIVPEIAACPRELDGRLPPVVRRLLGDDAQLLFAAAAGPVVPAAYVRCASRPHKPLYAAVDLSAARAQALGWDYAEIAAGHRPMTEVPAELLARFRCIAAGRGSA